MAECSKFPKGEAEAEISDYTCLGSVDEIDYPLSCGQYCSISCFFCLFCFVLFLLLFYKF